MTLPELNPSFVVAITAYTIGAASPGPSILAIMAEAMTRGRRAALALAAGCYCGSCFWGLSTALGMAALMRTYSWALVVLNVAGGAYMLWLAWKSARAALAPAPVAFVPSASAAGPVDARRAWLRGLALHLTNPKAIFVWLSIVALALGPAASEAAPFRVVGTCLVIGIGIFFGYALAFSTPLARRAYARVHRAFNAALCLVFGYAGLRLLLARVPTP